MHRLKSGSISGSIRFFPRVLTSIALLIFVLPFVGLMFYSPPNADDFQKAELSCNLASQPTRSIINRTWIAYTKLSGRWFTDLLQTSLMSKISLVGPYGWLLLLVMLINVAALAYFLAAFFRVPAGRALLAASALYAAWLSLLASPGQNVFWLTGAMEYQLPIVSMLLLAGLLCKPRQSLFTYVTLGLLAVAIPAQHEIAGAFLIAVLVVGVVVLGVLKLPARPWWMCLGLAAASYAAIILSPAMILKFAKGHKTPLGFAHMLPYARDAVDRGVGWMLNPAVLLCALLMPILLWPRRGSPEPSEYRPPRWFALLGIGVMCILLAELAGGDITTATSYGKLPYRVVGWFQFLFLLLFICIVLIGVPEISQIKFSPASQIGIAMLFGVTLLISGNFHLAEKDLRGPARAWWAGNVARLEQRGDSLQFGPLPPRPVLFNETSLSRDSGCWVNQCMATYMGSSAITVEQDEDPVFAGCYTEP